MEKKSSFILITNIILFFTILQITLGALVRLTGSGLSCPDWPLCYGFFIPSYKNLAKIGELDYTLFQIFLEWIHRFNGGIVIGILMLILLYFAKLNSIKFKTLWKTVIGCFILLITQGTLGATTVLDSNSPWSVAAHLFTALLFLGFLIRIRLLIEPKYLLGKKLPHRALVYILFTLFFISLVTISGAVMSKSGASLACNSWPLCEKYSFPSVSNNMEILHFMHRILVVILGIFIVILSIQSQKLELHNRDLYKIFGKLPIILFVFQVGLGAGIIFMELPVWLGILHQFIAIIIFSAIFTMGWLVYSRSNVNYK